MMSDCSGSAGYVVTQARRCAHRRFPLALLLISWTSGALAADGDDLAAQATDPTAALMSFQFSNAYTGSFQDLDDATSNQLQLRVALPFKLGERQHIFRITQPYLSSSPSGRSGLTDTTVFDLATFDRPWGRFGVGAVASLPTGADELTTDRWAIGPAFGFVNSSVKRVNWGLFVQSLFSVDSDDGAADVGIVNLQPIASYQLGKGRSFSLGNSALIYDSDRSQWSALQLGVNYGFIVDWAGHKWRPNFEVGYDFNDEPGSPEWTVRAGIVLLLPVR